MPTKTKAVLTTKAAILATILAISPAGSSGTPSGATAIDRAAARALVALVPEIRASIVAGQNVKFVDIDISQFNRSAYFGFFVSVPSEISSGLIGRYAVNKKTAELWDMLLMAWVCSPAIETQLRKLREKHHISAEVINQYGEAPILQSGEPPGEPMCREQLPSQR